MYKRTYPTHERQKNEKTEQSRHLDPPASIVAVKHRPEMAYEMWRAGKRAAEIGERLQVSTARVRQLVHRHAWTLRHPDFHLLSEL